jgi:hypothetical protein
LALDPSDPRAKASLAELAELKRAAPEKRRPADKAEKK